MTTAAIPASLAHLTQTQEGRLEAITVRLPDSMREELEQLAGRIGCDRSALIRTALRQWLLQLG